MQYCSWKLFAVEILEHCVVAGSLVPKLVGEKKTRNDDMQSMSASVFFVLYPALADYIVSVLKDASLCMNSSHSQCAVQHCESETLPLPSPFETSPLPSLGNTSETLPLPSLGNASETSPLRRLGNASEVGDASQTAGGTETHLKREHVVPVVTSSLLFPVLSLLCRLSPGLDVSDEGKK